MEGKSQVYIPLFDSCQHEESVDAAAFEAVHRSLFRGKPLSRSLLPWVTAALAVLLILSNILWLRYWIDQVAPQPTEYYRMFFDHFTGIKANQ